MNRVDLAEAKRWLQPCPPCEMGLPHVCECPPGSWRTMMAALIAEVERNRAVLGRVADLLSPCPTPPVEQGIDQCGHGTWPCEATEVAWLARAVDRDAELAAARAEWMSRFAELESV